MKEEENNNTEKVMTKDEKIADLEQRLARLEKIEKIIKIMSGISLGFKLIVIIILAIVTYKVYNTLITYKEKLDQVQNITDKLSTAEGFLGETLDKFNIFK